MWSLGIDQHARQITISLRDENGDVLRARQSSTQPEKVQASYRRLTTLRKEARQARTRVINKIKHIVRRHNLQWHLPTKTFPTKPAIAWLKALVLPATDRLEMNYLLADLEHLEQRYLDLEKVIAE